MPASNKTTLAAVNVIFKWCVAYQVKPRHVYHLLSNLRALKANKSFTQTLVNLTYAFRSDPRYSTVSNQLEDD